MEAPTPAAATNQLRNQLSALRDLELKKDAGSASD